MVFVVEYVIIVFRSLKPRGSNQFVRCAANSITRNVVLVLFAHRRDHVISSSYVNNTMSPNIEVECSKPEKG